MSLQGSQNASSPGILPREACYNVSKIIRFCRRIKYAFIFAKPIYIYA